MSENKKREKQKEFTSSYGNKFTFQKVGTADWVDMLDKVEDASGRTNKPKFYTTVLKHLVVNPPEMTMNDFDEEPYNEFDEMDEVCDAAVRFQRGK